MFNPPGGGRAGAAPRKGNEAGLRRARGPRAVIGRAVQSRFFYVLTWFLQRRRRSTHIETGICHRNRVTHPTQLCIEPRSALPLIPGRERISLELLQLESAAACSRSFLR